MASPLRVVFDTNAFSPQHFDQLEQSPMRKLCGRGTIIPIYGIVMIEETLRAYGHEAKRMELLQRWLPLIGDTVQRFCLDLPRIWHRELVQGRGLKTNIFMSTRLHQAFLLQMARIPPQGDWDAWLDSDAERRTEWERRKALREALSTIRQEVAAEANAQGLNHNDFDWKNFRSKEIDRVGREFLLLHLPCRRPSAVARKWSRTKSQYPYFTACIDNVLYSIAHAAAKPNARIDTNASADLDLMTHLLRADVLVSNEKGFLRSAFDDLWRPRGKVLFTSQEFVEFLRLFVG